MAKAIPTLPRVFLGAALRQLRADANKSLDDCAHAVGKDRPRMVKVFDGNSSLSTEELEALVDFLGAEPDRRREILRLGIDARKRSGPSPYTDLAPGSFQRLALLEALASDIWEYERGVFPAYLQSPEYVEALMDASDGIWWESSETERSKRVAFRVERQRTVFDPERPKQIDVFFSDDTLIAEVGSPAVMRHQLQHVLDLIDRNRHLTVQIVPNEGRNNPVQQGGLVIFRFGDSLRPVGFLSVPYGPSTYFDAAVDTERMTRAFNKIRELAYTPERTRDIIRAKLEEMT